VSALTWLVADLMLNSFSSIIIPYLNETFRLIVFLIVANIIFELKTALEKHKKLAMTDSLTGIANRRAFFNSANMELNKARRFGYILSILYMDVDNFKAVNDQYGHNIGDMFLRSVAETIKNNIRVIDICARLGGDEFGIILSETGAQSALAVANKLQGKLLKRMRDKDWPAGFSMGVAIFERTPDSVNEMITRADTLMYSAKKKGKNMIQHEIIGRKSNMGQASSWVAI
jgi:diguanylate cyclase (GGDEF)-like protein